MPKLLVIADDLTGANDAGAQFASHGVPVLVRPYTSSETLDWVDGLEVLAVTTESRHLDSRAAASRVSALAISGIAAGVTNFFKKIDSTMRGNTGSEMEALLTASGKSILPLIPAVPRLGRITRGGCQFVASTELHLSIFAEDPMDRIDSSYIPDILARQSKIPVWVIEHGEQKKLERSELKTGIYVFDATTDDDLLHIGEALNRRGLLEIVAGAAGFASVMPNLLDFARHPIELPRVSGRILVVNGSLNDVSIEQVACAERNGFAVFTLSPEVLVPPHLSDARGVDEAVTGILRVADGRDVVVRSIEHRDDLRRYLALGERLGFKPRDVHLRVADNIGRIVLKLMPGSEFKVIVVFGGDTLAAIVRSFRWSGLWPRGEITPGLVALEVDPDRELLLLTKAGGFGREDILRILMEDDVRGRNQ